MKSFYSPTGESSDGGDPVGAGAVVVPLFCSRAHARARIALYDTTSAAPRIEDVESLPVSEFIESLSSRVNELARSQGGLVPYTVIREIAENFIHADFNEPVVSILDSGSTIRFADQGPGIREKDRAVLPGFTTAGGTMKRFIRGVGSGLPLVREFLVNSGGSLVLEDNLGGGSVVTIYSPPRSTDSSTVVPTHTSNPLAEPNALADQPSFADLHPDLATVGPRLSTRQKHVLALVLESGLAGPSLVAKELGVGVSTAYRDLASLEEAGLIVSEAGKRTLTPEGLSYLGSLSKVIT